MKTKKRIWHAVLGSACILCAFLRQFPESLVPLAIFLYISLPPAESERRAAQRRGRSRAIRKKRAQVIEAVEREAPVRAAYEILASREQHEGAPAQTGREAAPAHEKERVLDETVA